MSKPYRLMNILFADITRSSSIYERLGDRAAQDVIGSILANLSEKAAKFDGRVIKTIGDAVMCCFESTDSAVDAGKAMLQAMSRPMGDSPDAPTVNIHIGIHVGPVVEENEDIFGDAVNVAARVVDYANPRQIVVTREVIDNLSENANHSIKYLASVTAKNISGEIELFEIVFDSQKLTTVLDTRKLAEGLYTSLYLTRNENSIVVDQTRHSISVGREEHNDIVINYSWISRTHARIDNRNGSIMVTDKSTNGTFIYPSNAEPIFVNKGEQSLAGAGVIVFGREKKDDEPEAGDDVVAYVVK